jgi:hypothetical protein
VLARLSGSMVPVRVLIEQSAREGPCPDCGVLTRRVKDRPGLPPFPDG